MKQVNKVLLFFVFLALLFVWSLYEIVQSSYVGERVSKRVEKLVEEKTNFNVSFKNIDLGFFPPRTSFSDVIISNPEQGIEQLNFGRLDIYFGIIDLFSKRISIGKVKFNHAFINLNKQRILQSKKTSKKNEELNLQDIFREYSNLRTQLPLTVRAVEFNNIKVFYGNDESQVNHLELKFRPNELNLLGDLFVKTDELEDYALKNIYQLTFNMALRPQGLNVNKLTVLNGINKIEIAGNYKNQNDFNIQSLQANLTIDPFVPLIEKKLKAKGAIPKGNISASGYLKKSPAKNWEGEFELEADKVSSEYYRFRKLIATIGLTKDLLSVRKAQTHTQFGEINLLTPFSFLRLSDLKYLEPKIELDIQKVQSSELFFFLSVFDQMNFELSGKTMLQFKNDYIVVEPRNGAVIENFELKSSEAKTILSQKKIVLDDDNSIVISYSGRVDIDTRLHFQSSFINLNAVIEKGGISAKILDSNLDFKEVGPIVGFSLEGKGPILGTIKGPFDKVIFDLNGELDKFGFLDLELGKVESDFRLELSDKTNLHIENMIGERKNLNYLASGDLYFFGDENLDLKIQIGSSKFREIKKVAPKLFSKIEPYVRDVNFDFKGDILLKGGFSLEKLIVDAWVEGDYFLVGEEIFDSFQSKIELKENTLYFKNFILKKISGLIRANAQFDLEKGSLSYSLNTDKMRLDEFKYYQSLNMGYSAFFKAELKGKYDKKLENTLYLETFDSRLDNLSVKEGYLKVDQNGDKYTATARMLGQSIRLDGTLDTSSKKKSSVSLKVDSEKLENIIRFAREYNVTEGNINGEIALDLELDFYFNQFEDLNLDFNLYRFSFENRRVRLDSIPPLNIIIKNGKIKPWDLRWSGKEFELVSTGKGELGENFDILVKLDSDMSLAKVFESKIIRAFGPITYFFNLHGEGKSYQASSVVKAQGADLQIQNVPGWIKNIKGEAVIENNVITIDSLTSDYGGGKASLEGKIFLKDTNEYDLALKVDKSRVEFWNKSYVVVSGKANLKGEDYPYDLVGNVEVLYGEVLEDMDTLTASALSSESYKKFLPKGYLEGTTTLINMDLEVETLAPVRVRNSLLDLSLGADLRVFSSLTDSKMSGEVAIVGSSSKFLFKGHEFLLSEGRITLRDDKEQKKKPELRFRGSTQINNYDISIYVNGPTNNILLELNSNPPLSQEDILSLLTLGVTSDISKNLDDREKQSLTGLSVGSLIVDQLKINQKLNDSLGLRLSVQPEFIDQNGSSLLQGRTTEGTGTSQVRSSTSVRVQKNLGEKANLSISSTVGGTVSQKQEMNLNYSINPSWSLEGVYEIRSNDDLETQTQESAGADLKYMWSF